MNTILVLIEGYDEQKPVVRGLKAIAIGGTHSAYRAKLDARTEVVVVTTGVGPEQAQRVAAECMDHFNPSLVVSAGTCGALVPGIEMSEWVVTGTVRRLSKPGADGRVAGETIMSPATELIGQLAKAIGSEPGYHRGTLVTVSDVPVVDAEEKEAIASKHQAIAVDMESYGIARAAADRDIPWLIARVVVDTTFRPLPELGPMNIVTGRPPLPGIFLYVLKNPLSGPQILYGLWQLIQVYARHLVRVLPVLSEES